MAGCTEDILTKLTELLDETAASTICDGDGCTGDAAVCAIRHLNGLANDTSATDDIVLGLNAMYLLVLGSMVFLMQLGFAMLCAGLLRRRNQQNILLKNVLDACVGAVAWYLCGYAFAFGRRESGGNNAFIGTWNFALKATVDASLEDSSAFAGTLGWPSYFFQFAFAAAAATIVSGAVAERCSFIAYLLYSFLMTGFIYPVVVHSVWSSDGWLSAFSTNWNGYARILKTGAIDYAGSGVVHMTGGVAALVGAWLMGPRLGRFKDGKILDAMEGHSPHHVVLGTLVLWFGWYGFNPGSQLAISGFLNASIASRVAVTTTLAAGAGGMTALLFSYVRSGAWDLHNVCNGILAGLVGITAGCSVVEPWAALIAGSFGALAYYGATRLLIKLQIDDAVGAFPVHGAAGAVGVLFPGFLAAPKYVDQVYGSYGMLMGAKRYGWFYGGHGQVMLCQVIEILFIFAWVGTCMFTLFSILKFFNLLRVPPEVEQEGLDSSMHGGKQYKKQEDVDANGHTYA